MFRRSHPRTDVVVAVLALIGVVGATAGLALTRPASVEAGGRHDRLLRFDVAEDPTRFVFAPTPVHDDGLPAYGNYFVTQGYLYPEGTLDDSDGVLADGSPAFPDKVLGEWTCWGTHVGDGAHTGTGPIVVTTELFQLGDGYEEATIVTEGYELVDVGEQIRRAITGGTGQYSAAAGEQRQRLLGLGATNGVKLRVELRVEPPRSD